MRELRKGFDGLIEKISQYFIGSDRPESKNQTNFKKWLNLALVVGFIIICFITLLLFIGRGSEPSTNLSKINPSSNSNISSDLLERHEKIELGSDATKGEVKWQNFLEESIETEGKTRQEQIDLLKSTIAKNQEAHKIETNNEYNELKGRLSYALKEIESLKEENQNMKSEIAMLTPEDTTNTLAAELGITAINSKTVTKPPVSSFNNIPATSYVSGHLLGGIAVSTSVNSASEPIPVVIKLTARDLF